MTTVQILINAGADLNLKNEHGETALMIARLMSAQDIVDMLLMTGASTIHTPH